MINRAVIALNNFAVRLRRTRCRPHEVLVLFSRCLQRSACDRKIVEDLANCQRCGQCLVTRFLEMGERYGVRLRIATGGREAALHAADPSVKAVVAVACDKELRAGLVASLPKAVLAQSIEWPCGPCKDTTVEFDRVEEAVRWLLR